VTIKRKPQQEARVGERSLNGACQPPKQELQSITQDPRLKTVHSTKTPLN
jgi:hypothetical protein